MSNLKQLSARERINLLLDDNSFVEIGAFVHARSTDFNMTSIDTPADGVITGYGVIDGNLVYVYSQDASVMNGAIGEMHAKKISRMYELALKVGAPVIGLIDCAGMRLQEATDALNAFGELYFKQTMASGVVPQISAIFGACGGGVAMIPALTDFTLMTRENARLFVNTPNALENNDISKCDTSSCDYQSSVAGTVDYVGDSEEDVLARIRMLISLLPANCDDEGEAVVCTDDLNRENSVLASVKDTAYILQDISDGHVYFELKPDYAPEMVTAFIRLNGMTVGAVANRTEFLGEDGTVAKTEPASLSSDGAVKAAEFVSFCDAFSIPVLTLVNVEGYKATMDEEKTIAKACAKLTHAFADATVPKVTVIIDKAFGSAYLAMNSRHIGADMVYAYPDAQIGMMNAQSAVKIMYAHEIKESDNARQLIADKASEFEKMQNSPVSAAARGYVDDIIEPAATRKRVIAAFEMLYTKREDRPAKKHGTI
ncbi:acetyl-CoA carboxylase carboxyltransferase component [Catenibacillus scindens]|uniref:Acetyl-CoA carboxylase carboxyltransferase component n=1 Tax=Catenibacillus scindens TaxID=673271 RepID=A0A7W8HAZ9_9FIRM|nr:carboxyl transferase domain-containing protein [Catenibacillus scindens]MBB5265146.1 acetyl-CoA carboxylase carboxyltransferase component [Catenibacillus scindens]